MGYKHVACMKCQKLWAILPAAPPWNGTQRGLKKVEDDLGRKWNQCYCGESLYNSSKIEERKV